MQDKMYEKMNPGSIKKEVAILYEAGLKSYEIQYLMDQKRKHRISHKWH